MNDSNLISQRSNSGLFFSVAVSNCFIISFNSKICVSAFFDVIVLRIFTGELAGDAVDPRYFHVMFWFVGQYGATTLLLRVGPLLVVV